MTIEEAATRMSMSVRYVRRLVADRRIPFHKFGRSVRLAETDVSAFISAGRVDRLSSADAWSSLQAVA
ncbi:excisionase family DNA-binding protein [Catellatospora sp. NPDC049609]|uniref:excisionase family DNA-binding protein n=1 Tax=Catellatospora sp. NPDC049609 TaxID=3155505 RepID=UPI00342E069E